MTVVVLAQQADTPVDVVIRELAAREVPVFRADTSWCPRELVLEAWLSTENYAAVDFAIDADGRWVFLSPTAQGSTSGLKPRPERRSPTPSLICWRKGRARDRACRGLDA